MNSFISIVAIMFVISAVQAVQAAPTSNESSPSMINTLFRTSIHHCPCTCVKNVDMDPADYPPGCRLYDCYDKDNNGGEKKKRGEMLCNISGMVEESEEEFEKDKAAQYCAESDRNDMGSSDEGEVERKSVRENNMSEGSVLGEKDSGELVDVSGKAVCCGRVCRYFVVCNCCRCVVVRVCRNVCWRC